MGKGLDDALAAIDKQYGQGSIWRMGDNDSMDIEVIPTGCLSLDIALGAGGYPKGRITEIYGPESSGKSTLAQHAVYECQQAGGVCAYVDAENALDPVYAAAIGVNVDQLIVAQPDDGEQALDIVDKLVESGEVDLIIVDSVAALVPRAELKGEYGDSNVGLHARMMSQAMRKLSGKVNRSKTTVIFINQIREKIGIMFGSPEVTPGGRALKFYASVRLDIRRIESIKDGENVVGNRTRVKVVKNKIAAPFKQCEFDITYGEGVSRSGDLVDVATKFGVLTKSGAWFSYHDRQLGQGRPKTKEMLSEDPVLFSMIKDEVLACLNPETSDTPSQDEL